MSACTIYALTDASGDVRYIGKTVNARKRLSVHLSDARRGKRSYTCYWIRSMQTAPIMRPLMVVEEYDGAEMERRAVAIYRQRGCRLTNVTIGGDGITPTARANMRAARAAAAPRRFGPIPKLTEIQRQMIPLRLARGECATDLGREWGVSSSTIGRYRDKRVVPEGVVLLSEAQRMEIRRRFAAGDFAAALAREFGVSPGRIRTVAHYRHDEEEKAA